MLRRFAEHAGRALRAHLAGIMAERGVVHRGDLA